MSKNNDNLYQLFARYYPAGFIRSGNKSGGTIASRWAVSFDGNKIYEYTGTLRGTVERVLGGKLTRQDWDQLNNIIGRCKNGCPITAMVRADHCLNCGCPDIIIYTPAK